MKKIIAICFCLATFIGARAQKTVPEIKAGTAMYASAFVQGQEFPLLLTVKSITAPVSIGWSVEGYGEGAFEMSVQSVESGTQFLAVTQPALGVTKLSDTETFGIISKAAFKTLSDTKAFTYGGAKFKVKSPETGVVKISGKEVDVFHVISEDGKQELWILNNAAFPIIVQSIGQATDIVISEIK
ncbi:hypothetical protein [Pedobacter sp. Leaf176]|uniref:hypothetical protein n=1 Tax=Pedobacter sp. Leaf176 TaxID=1736286 RepID=UPI0006FA7E2A|nr:hypothetical protein [Pedobacter sp. Leaf176]KQR66880.1 hypothetical protein ASF92_19195 [Pedobacter sp. Leaf176]